MEVVLTPWRRLVRLLQLDSRDIRQVIYYAVFAGLVALTLPLGIQAIINLLQGATISTSWIVLIVLVTLGVIFQGVLQFMQVRILENIQQKVFTRASFEFAYRFPKLSMEQIRDQYPPELANRFFDILTVQKGLPKIVLDYPAALLQIIFSLILLSLYHPFFIAYGILLLLLVFLVFKFTFARGMKTSLLESKAKYKVAHWLQEVARSLVSFKLSGRTSLAMDRNNELTDKYLQYRESHFRILMQQYIQMIGFKVLVTAGLLVIGGVLVLNNQMNIGQFVAAEIIILLVISSVEKLITGLDSFYDVLTSLEKIGQVVDIPLERKDGTPPPPTTMPWNLQLERVGLDKDNGIPLLKDVNVSIQTGDHIRIIGPPGSGKSSLLKMITGLIRPSSGAIYLNDNPIRGTNLRQLRSHMGQVLPEQMPFEGTILENITFGAKDIPMERVMSVIRAMGLQDFVREKKNGVNDILLSQGQRIPHTVSKKILLARAVVHMPQILILKNALEHFDLQEAERIMTYLCHADQPWMLVVSSPLEQWKNHTNRTLTIEDGTLTEILV